MSITRNGIEIPDEFADSEEMIQVYMASNPRKNEQQEQRQEQQEQHQQEEQRQEQNEQEQKSEDVIEKIELSKYKELETQHNEIVGKYSELQKKAENYVDVDPDAYRLSYIKNKTPDQFQLYATLKLGHGMKPLDILVEEYALENPDFAGKKAEIAEMLIEKYGLDIDIPKPLDPAENDDDLVAQRNSEIEKAQKKVRIREMQMEADSKKATQKLLSKFDEIEIPVAKRKTEEEIKAEKETAKTAWAPVVGEVFKTLNSVPLYLPAKEGAKPEVFLDFAMTDEMKKNYAEAMTGFLVESGAQMTQESLAVAVHRFRNSFVADNLPEIISSVAAKVRKMTEEDYDREFAAPSGLMDKNKNKTIPPNKYDESIQKIMEAEGVRIK